MSDEDPSKPDKRLLKSWRDLVQPRRLLFWLMISALVAFAGPFGTFRDFSYPVRFVYWGGMIGVASIIGMAVHDVRLAKLGPARGGLKTILFETVLFTALFVPLLFVLTRAVAPYRTLPPSSLFSLILTVAGVAMMAQGIRQAFQKDDESTEQAADAQDTVLPRLLRRLPGGEAPDAEMPCVKRLEADNHHTVIHLRDGSVHRVLLRLSDAIEELDGIEGGLTHRSHWVAYDMIRGQRREGHRNFVTLTDGSEVPLSRTYRPELRDAGYLPDKD